MKKYDVVVIGLGPAGMAVTNIAAEMGLKVLAVESRNVGTDQPSAESTPSSPILSATENNPLLAEPFARINADIGHIRDKKITALAGKADLVLGQGYASFVNEHCIQVAGKEYSGKNIFIATGTRPLIPPIEGLDQVDFLTNENLFELDAIPASMTFIGGGTIGCEMAQAFAKMGAKCTIIHDKPHLLPYGEKHAGEILQRSFEKMGMNVHNACRITHVSKREDGRIVVHTDDGLEIESDKLMVAAGRNYDFSSLNLEKAGVEYGSKGIVVDEYLRTTNKYIHAVGDCNGSFLLSNAASHQGMLALVNTVVVAPLKKKYLKNPAPWTVYTDPQISHVGRTTAELEAEGVEYEVIEAKIGDSEDAEGKAESYVRVFASSAGSIHGVSIVGGNSSEMISEWSLAIQHNINIYDLMMTMQSFPTMGFVSKQIGETGETWMMQNVQPSLVKKILRFLF